MKQAHVICMNDSPAAVHLGTAEEAQAAIEPLARAYYDQNPWHWKDRAQLTPHKNDFYAAYRLLCYWHVHTVSIVN